MKIKNGFVYLNQYLVDSKSFQLHIKYCQQFSAKIVKNIFQCQISRLQCIWEGLDLMQNVQAEQMSDAQILPKIWISANRFKLYVLWKCRLKRAILSQLSKIIRSEIARCRRMYR
jgi:hypothetical protein